MGFLREPSHLLLVILVVVVLFGSRRLPDAARGIGQAMRIFKSEIKTMQTDETPKRPTAEPAEPPLEGKIVPPQAPRANDPVRETPRNL
jgi:sec-independent protein translocase protein TatA